MNQTKAGRLPRKATIVRATSLLMTRTVDEDARVIEGVASTASVDSYNDIVEPLGAKFSLPIPLLWQHSHREPVGSVTYAVAERSGIRFKAQIARIAEPGTLKARTDEAWQSIKSELVRCVSIGFQVLKAEPIVGGGVRYTEWKWHELSLVTIPANADAVITDARSLTPAEAEVELVLRSARSQFAADVAAGRWKPDVVVKLR
ncbi:Peptidase U35 phage prohead HK97 [Paraburkholderia sacchari]|uniref:HK97 family phage prohead protease n=1 Tax=Paraburkholderia sacchari TaxID=159450 RepID=UPI0039A6ED73